MTQQKKSAINCSEQINIQHIQHLANCSFKILHISGWIRLNGLSQMSFIGDIMITEYQNNHLFSADLLLPSLAERGRAPGARHICLTWVSANGQSLLGDVLSAWGGYLRPAQGSIQSSHFLLSQVLHDSLEALYPVSVPSLFVLRGISSINHLHG